MRLVVIYRPNSEHSRLIEDFVHEYEARHSSGKLEVIDIDSKDGIATATLYDVVEYPAILVIENDGYIQKIWQGMQLPLIDEVAAYANN